MRRVSLWGSCLIVAALAPAAAGDQIMLASGGKLDGKLDAQASTPTKAVIVTSSGARITVDRTQIQQVIAQPSALEEYEQIKRRYKDTADDQYRLAEWCRQKKLGKQRQAHLARVTQLDPKHAHAHAALGHVLVAGRWLTQDEAMAQKGLVRYGNRWVLPQEKTLLEQKAAQAGTQKTWYQQVRLWKGWLVGSDRGRGAEALAKLKAIDDPLAVEPLVRALGKENEAIREILAQVLGKIAGPEATEALVGIVLADPSTAVRWAALDELGTRQDPKAVQIFIVQLRSPANVVVRRSAEALGELGGEKAIAPLIAALVTQHEVLVKDTPTRPAFVVGQTKVLPLSSEPVVAPGVVGFQQMPIQVTSALWFGSGGASGRVVRVDLENNEALFALQKLTGENLGFRTDLWAQWYRAKAAKPAETSSEDD